MTSADGPRASFFPPVPTSLPWDELDDLVGPRNPVWSGPPPGIRPGVVALSVELGRSSSTVVLLEGARAYPQGVVLRLVVRVRTVRLSEGRYLFDQLDVTHGRGGFHLALPAGGLRWGLELADGGTVTTLDETVWNEYPDGTDPADWVPDHPVLHEAGLPARAGDTWSRDVWLWPLPPAGRIRAVCAWPDRGITETETRVDAAPLRDAAARAVPLWP